MTRETHIINDIVFSTTAEFIIDTLMLPLDAETVSDIEALTHRANAVVKPKVLYAVAAVLRIDGSRVDIDGHEFHSEVLARNLSEGQVVFPHIATCGSELDGLESELSDALMVYALDCIKQSALEAAIREFHTLLAESHGLQGFATMNPGAGDARVWPIQQQAELFNLLGDVSDRIGVCLSESFLMIPNKTISGITFDNKEGYSNCRMCMREGCSSRQEPFDEQMWYSTYLI